MSRYSSGEKHPPTPSLPVCLNISAAPILPSFTFGIELRGVGSLGEQLSRSKRTSRLSVFRDIRSRILAMSFIFCPTSKMSHAGSWRAACQFRFSNLSFRFDHRERARGVTDPGVGSGALLGLLAWWSSSRCMDGWQSRENSDFITALL